MSGIVAPHALDQLVLPHHSRLGWPLDFAALSTACGTTLRLRSSGARVRDWFCIRGRSVVERAIVFLVPARHDRPGAGKDITTFVNGCKHGISAKGSAQTKTNGPGREPGRGRNVRSRRRPEAPHSSSSGCSSGGVSPSRPLSSSSSVMRSVVTSVSSASTLPARCGDERGSLGLGLVDLNVFLQRMNELFLEVVRRYRLLGDLAQCDHRVLVVVAIDRDLRARRDHAGTVAASSTRSKRFSTLSMQSSTVTRAMGACSCNGTYEKRQLGNDTAAKVQDEFRGSNSAWRGGSPLLGKTHGNRQCDPYLYTFGLVVTASVCPQLSGV